MDIPDTVFEMQAVVDDLLLELSGYAESKMSDNAQHYRVYHMVRSLQDQMLGFYKRVKHVEGVNEMYKHHLHQCCQCLNNIVQRLETMRNKEVLELQKMRAGLLQLTSIADQMSLTMVDLDPDTEEEENRVLFSPRPNNPRRMKTRRLHLKRSRSQPATSFSHRKHA